MLRNKFRTFTPIIIIFVVVNGLLVAGRNSLESRGFDQEVLIYANILLLAATFFSFILARRGLHKENTHAFVRGIMASIMIKMLLCFAAALAYILASDGQVNKPSLFTAMGLYLVYTFVEVNILMKLTKQKQNA